MNREISFCYDDQGYYVNNKCFFITSDEIDLKYLNGLFLSKLYKFLFQSMSSSLGKETVEMRKSYIKKVPILHSEHYEKAISSEVSIILEKNKLLTPEIRSFRNWLRRTFGIDTLSKKLEKYYELNFEEFLLEIKKKKVDITQRKTQDLLEKEFYASLEIIGSLQREIKETDDKINQLVYELYELTEEEISIIEEKRKVII